MSGNDFAINTLMEAEGWEALDLSHYDQLTREQREQALIVAGYYQAVFTQTEQGRFVLRQLVTDYLLPRIANPDDDGVAIGIRQGGADVVRKILALIEFARSGGAST